MKTIVTALGIALAGQSYRWAAVVGFVGFLALYLFTLPSSYTGGQIGLISLRFLDAGLVALSVALAALSGLTVPVMLYLIRQGQRASKVSAAGGVLVSVLTPLLCCSPILPLVLGFAASLAPSLVGVVSWRLQGFIATHQAELFLAAAGLLIFALHQNAKRVVQGARCRTNDTG
jgi:hypothetical protein